MVLVEGPAPAVPARCLCENGPAELAADDDVKSGQARANLLDSMVASSTSSSDTEVDSDTGDEEEECKYQHLHAIHRVRRFKKAVDREQCVVRYIPPPRPSILDRKDFYFRYGEKEQEAVASFDFLEGMSTSVSDVGSVETLNENDGKNGGGSVGSDVDDGRLRAKKAGGGRKYSRRRNTENGGLTYDDVARDLKLSVMTLHSQDGEIAERLSLSDSCAESFSCSSSSLNLDV